MGGGGGRPITGVGRSGPVDRYGYGSAQITATKVYDSMF